MALIAVLLAWLAASVSAVETRSADQLIQQVEARYNATRTLSVHFIERYEVMGHARPPESGLLLLRKRAKMRWIYDRPEGKLLISDGKTVYLYTAGDNRVEKMPLRDTEDMRAPLAFLLGHLDLRREFRGFAAHPGTGGDWLDAAARSDRASYEKVRMLIGNKGLVEKLEVFGRDSSTVAFEFTGEQLNPPVDDSLFRFSIPPGAQVVDSIEFGGEGK